MSTRKMLAEWEAWDVLAVQFLRRKPPERGLCDAIASLEIVGLITEETGSRMQERIDDYLGRTKSGYAYEVYNESTAWPSFSPWRNDTSREAREGRAMAALWMACEAAWEASGRAIADFRASAARHGAAGWP